MNNVYSALAHYWLAEIAFRADDFEGTLVELSKFQATPGSATLSQYKRSLYSKAYAHFAKEDYTKSATAFRLFLGQQKPNTKLANDAELRLADSYFMTGQYGNAINYYQTYLGRNVPDADYASFQQSLCFGLVDESEKKACSLEQLVKRYPNSVYATAVSYTI